jgi:hypothetical protein
MMNKLLTIVILVLLFLLINLPAKGGESNHLQDSVEHCIIRVNELQAHVDNANNGFIKVDPVELERMKSQVEYWDTRCKNLQALQDEMVKEEKLKQARKIVDETTLWQKFMADDKQKQQLLDAVQHLEAVESAK